MGIRMTGTKRTFEETKDVEADQQRHHIPRGGHGVNSGLASSKRSKSTSPERVQEMSQMWNLDEPKLIDEPQSDDISFDPSIFFQDLQNNEQIKNPDTPFELFLGDDFQRCDSLLSLDLALSAVENVNEEDIASISSKDSVQKAQKELEDILRN